MLETPTDEEARPARKPKEDEPSNDLKAAIKNYTAVGGPQSAQFLATDAQRVALFDWVESGTVSTKGHRILSFDREEWIKHHKTFTTAGETITPRQALFQSFSSQSDRAPLKGGDIFVTLITEGKYRGRSISRWSLYQEEAEILVPGTSRWIVRSAKMKSPGSWEIVVAEAPKPAPVSEFVKRTRAAAKPKAKARK